MALGCDGLEGAFRAWGEEELKGFRAWDLQVNRPQFNPVPQILGAPQPEPPNLAST